MQRVWEDFVIDYTNQHDWNEKEGYCRNCGADNCGSPCPSAKDDPANTGTPGPFEAKVRQALNRMPHWYVTAKDEQGRDINIAIVGPCHGRRGDPELDDTVIGRENAANAKLFAKSWEMRELLQKIAIEGAIGGSDNWHAIRDFLGLENLRCF
jgi:hypothetical protein